MARLLPTALVERLEGHAINDQATLPIAPSMAGVMRRFGASYLSRFGGSVSHRKAIHAIASCRTAALGGHVLECGPCDTQDYAYHSCRHRSCPKCMRDEGQKWFETRCRELLPVPYFHVVFTVPKELNRIVQSHQKALYPVLMQAAARTLHEVAGAPEYLGGTPCVMTALHTWSSTLIYHLHVHCLLPAGAVDEHGKWRAAKGARLAPQSALAHAFRAKLRAMMKAAVPDLELPEAAFDTVWQVHVEQPPHGPEKVLRYLGRSLHRGPLPDYTILEVTDEEVVFKYRAGDRRKWRTMTLPGHEFLRRFLQHVWPDRVHKARYSALWSRKNRAQLEAIRQELLAREPVALTSTPDSATTAPSVVAPSEPTRHWLQCPHCRRQRVIVSRFEPGASPPPLRPRPMATSPPTQPP